MTAAFLIFGSFLVVLLRPWSLLLHDSVRNELRRLPLPGESPPPHDHELAAEDDVGKVFVALWAPGAKGNAYPMIHVHLRFAVPFDLGLSARGDRRFFRRGREPSGDERRRVNAFLPRALLARIPHTYRVEDEGIFATFHGYADDGAAIRRCVDGALDLARVLDARRACVPPAAALLPWVPAVQRIAAELGLTVDTCPLGVTGWTGRPPAAAQGDRKASDRRSVYRSAPSGPVPVSFFLQLHFTRDDGAYRLALRVRPHHTPPLDAGWHDALSRAQCPGGLALLASLTAWGKLTFVDCGFDVRFETVPSPEMFGDVVRATREGLVRLGEELAAAT